MARTPLDITERLKLLARGDNLDLADLVCADAIVEIQRLRDLLTRAAPAIERVWGMETSGPRRMRWRGLTHDIQKAVPAVVP